MSNSLFSLYKLGNIELNNRVVMSPMTRCRCENSIPQDSVVKYYQQRCEAGLIVTEGTSPSPNGLGYARIPGLFSEDHVKGWKKVTDSVHKEGSRIFVQLMHTGRVGHTLNLPPNAEVLAPSAVTAPGEMYTDSAGLKPHTPPREMSAKDIENALSEFEKAARLAMKAGFDGVELHGANGYLIDQFLNTQSNKRNDIWGGSVEGRARFAIEVAKRVGGAIGFDKVGMRLSPYGEFNGMKPDSDHDVLYATLAKSLSELGLAYLHLVDHSSMGMPPVKDEIKSTIRELFEGSLILSGGYDGNRAQMDLDEKKGDLVAFGRPFIANPNLVSKLKSNSSLAAPDPNTFYTPGEKGYTDYQ